MLKQKQWFWLRRSQLYVGSKEMNSSFSKFKGSIFAILFGLIIACFVIIGSGQNAFNYFELLLMYAFASKPSANWDNTLVWWAVYIVAGLALVVSFKTGMFNIGVSGQMLAAGAVVIAIGVRYNLSQPLAIIFALGAGTLVAMVVAIITALLKVFFNVHEVVSSILLNWTIWYLIKWIFKNSNDLFDASHGTTTIMHDSMSMNIGGYNCILPLILAFTLVIGIWFLLKKTTLGYKVRTVGLNPFAADYAGINRKKFAVTSFAISGALAGVMAVIYYVAQNPAISFLNDDLPAIGFDSIAVSLVGQINPWGVIGAAFLWGLIKSGGSIGTVLDLPTATGDIIFGVIIYSAACAVLLSKLEPIKFLIRYCNILFNQEKRKTSHQYVVNMWRLFIKTFIIKRTYQPQINELKLIIKNQKIVEIKILKKTYLEELAKIDIAAEKLAFKNQIKLLKTEYQTELAKIDLKAEKLALKNQIKLLKNNHSQAMKKQQADMKHQIKLLKTEYQTELAKIDLKAEKLALKNQIKLLKDNYYKTVKNLPKNQVAILKAKLHDEITNLSLTESKILQENFKNKMATIDYSQHKKLVQEFQQTINKLELPASKQLQHKFKEAINNLAISAHQQLHQDLKQNINKIQNTENEQLKQLLMDKNDEIGVCWARISQEHKAWLYYIYKQYNNIWNKGKIGKWNELHKAKKAIYGKTLNEYISHKNDYETQIYHWKQELLAEIILLKKQKSPTTQALINQLKEQFKVKFKIEKENFANLFNNIIKTEAKNLQSIELKKVGGEK